MSRKKQVNQKITALYCRISLDDGGDNESMSISNQKLMLKEFAEKNGMFQYEYYAVSYTHLDVYKRQSWGYLGHEEKVSGNSGAKLR